MVVLVIPKNEEDPIKNEVARVATTCVPQYNSMGAICCHGNQSPDPTWPTFPLLNYALDKI